MVKNIPHLSHEKLSAAVLAVCTRGNNNVLFSQGVVISITTPWFSYIVSFVRSELPLMADILYVNYMFLNAIY